MKTRFIALWAGLLSLAATAALAEGCDAVTAARIKQLHTPNRSTLSALSNGRMLFGEIAVEVGGQRYSKITGFINSVNWDVKPWNPDADEAAYRKSIAGATQTCRPDGAEQIRGEEADIYAVHRETNGKASDERIWIVRSSGLPLRAVQSLQGNDTSTETWEYDDVQAPDTTFHL
jgi:hypothetical protein